MPLLTIEETPDGKIQVRVTEGTSLTQVIGIVEAVRAKLRLEVLGDQHWPVLEDAKEDPAPGSAVASGHQVAHEEPMGYRLCTCCYRSLDYGEKCPCFAGAPDLNTFEEGSAWVEACRERGHRPLEAAGEGAQP